MTIAIDAPKLQSELQELAGAVRVKVKLNSHLPTACSISEYDRKGRYGFDIQLNPKHIRDQKELEEHLDWCRESLTTF